MIAAKCAELKRENGVLENRVAELKSVEDKARADAISEIIRLGRFCVPSFGAETIKAVCGEMSYAQLLEFKKRIRKDVMKEQSERPKSVFYNSENNETEESGGLQRIGSAIRNTSFRMKR